MAKKLWSGRFKRQENPLMERFNASITFDHVLYREDIMGSRSHAMMLRKVGIITAAEHKRMDRGLQRVFKEIESGKFRFNPAQEDIHMAVEGRLRRLIGSTAGKLHTARSRNDQVALDTRLFTRDATKTALKNIRAFQRVLLVIAKRRRDIIMPGYTHLQRAQPVLLAHHLLAYVEMLARDHDRFKANLKRLNQCPLGAGALAGTTLPIDRQMTARMLGFSEPTRNSLDTVADRDFVLDYLYSAATLMMHLSRIAEELVLWSTQEFGFVRLPEGFCTGSSMMPQKVNPDAPELIRGKCGRAYGNLMRVFTVMKGLPLAYNKDMQEDKEALFDSAATVNDCLEVLTAMFPGIKFNAEKMRAATREGFVLATELADYLAQRGVPFREAHEIVGKLVRVAETRGIGLERFTLPELKEFSPRFEKGAPRVLNLESAVTRRCSYGGTAPVEVGRQLRRRGR